MIPNRLALLKVVLRPLAQVLRPPRAEVGDWVMRSAAIGSAFGLGSAYSASRGHQHRPYDYYLRRTLRSTRQFRWSGMFSMAGEVLADYSHHLPPRLFPAWFRVPSDDVVVVIVTAPLW